MQCIRTHCVFIYLHICRDRLCSKDKVLHKQHHLRNKRGSFIDLSNKDGHKIVEDSSMNYQISRLLLWDVCPISYIYDNG